MAKSKWAWDTRDESLWKQPSVTVAGSIIPQRATLVKKTKTAVPQLCCWQGPGVWTASGPVNPAAVPHFPSYSPTPWIPDTYRTKTSILVHLLRSCLISKAFSILVWSSSVLGKQIPHHAQYWALVQPKGQFRCVIRCLSNQTAAPRQVQPKPSPDKNGIQRSVLQTAWNWARGGHTKPPEAKHTNDNLHQRTLALALLFPSAHQQHQIGSYQAS